jgi:hypothetical protein
VSALPDLLTVEEAARLIRVGRTKAYAMAREWRATNGRSGLPVVDFGNVLRVPRRALEELIGVELTGTLDAVDRPSSAAALTSPHSSATRARPRRASARTTSTAQPALFNPARPTR